MKIVCGLGNPGPRYAATRHNLGWWITDRVAADLGATPFRTIGPADVAEARYGGRPVLLVKPLTYMNRSGAALELLRAEAGFDAGQDLLVVVDDAALDVGRIRCRARGSAGGHNGLKSIEAALGTQEYARLRVGVGIPPPGTDLVDWVLSPFEPEDAATIAELIPVLADAVRTWLDDGIEAAIRRYNR